MDQIEPNSCLRFHKLEVRREKIGLVVGRKETGEFVSLDSLGEETLKLLMDGLTISETESVLKSRGKDTNVASFASNIIDLGFASVSDSPHKNPNGLTIESENDLGRYRLPFLVVIICWIIFLSVAIFRIALNPSTLYAAVDSLWKLNFMVLYVLIFGIFLLDGAIHESFHYLSAKLFGVPAKIGLSVRLFEPVFQTELHALWSVNRKKRYIVLFAGLMWESLALSLFLLVKSAFQLPQPLSLFLSGYIFLNIMVIISEFAFFTKTDVYFILVTALNCGNLRDDSINYLKYLWRRAFGKLSGKYRSSPATDPLKVLPAWEKKTVKWYTWFMIVGSLAFLIFSYLISFWGVVSVIALTVAQFINGLSASNVPELGLGAAGLGIFAFNALFPVYFYVRKWRKRNSLIN